MSHALIARSTDLTRLQEDGYTLRISDSGYLVIENVPYVTASREVQEGSLIMELALSGDVTVPPTSHIAYWHGEFPHQADGTKLVALLQKNAETISVSGSTVYQLSAKPENGYENYYHKVSTYVEILSREAQSISPDVTARQWKVVVDQDDTESVFHFMDTASARYNISDLAQKLHDEKIAIVGVGGTGSWVLDFVAKTWVREIHVFDGDKFLQHNAFRSPGPFSRDELEGGPFKPSFHVNRYLRMRRKALIPHNSCIDETNVQQLGEFDTVFLCIDGHPIKAEILETCMANNTLLIDVGMGLYRSNNSLAGTIRTTTFFPEHHEHANHCIDLSGDDVPGEYERNVQLAELNALNAALAVIRWKKVRGFYSDQEQELNSEYIINGNKLINSYCLDKPS